MNEFIKQVLRATDGKFFTVTFIKKDGSVRVMNCRLGVKKHLKGGTSTLDAEKFLTVWDTQAKGYRAVNFDTVQSVAVDGMLIVRADYQP